MAKWEKKQKLTVQRLTAARVLGNFCSSWISASWGEQDLGNDKDWEYPKWQTACSQVNLKLSIIQINVPKNLHPWGQTPQWHLEVITPGATEPKMQHFSADKASDLCTKDISYCLRKPKHSILTSFQNSYSFITFQDKRRFY